MPGPGCRSRRSKRIIRPAVQLRAMTPEQTNAKRVGNSHLAAAGAGVKFGVTDLWILMMTIIWGSNFTVIKYAIEDLSPLSFTGIRFAIATVVMLAITRARGADLVFERSDLLKLFALALLTNVVYQTSFM